MPGFLKGDISGIQSFIFRIASRGAARQLKGRSLYVQLLSRFCITHQKRYMEQEPEIIYEGGGNFYFSLPTPLSAAQLYEQSGHINQHLAPLGIYLVLSQIEVRDTQLNSAYGDCVQQLNAQSARDRQRKYQQLPELFQPLDLDQLEEPDW